LVEAVGKAEDGPRPARTSVSSVNNVARMSEAAQVLSASTAEFFSAFSFPRPLFLQCVEAGLREKFG
jgi:hypothetical protein